MSSSDVLSRPGDAAPVPDRGDVLLELEDWRVTLDTEDGSTPIVRGVDLQVRRGESLALVGESGSGKTMTTMTALGLTTVVGLRTSGTVRLAGQDLTAMSTQQAHRHRSANVGVIFQDHLSSLNPVRTIGSQLVDAVSLRTGRPRKQCRDEASELLAQVGLPHPRRQLRSYPFEMSGGMRQRVMIAIALAGGPKVLVADEPTTALDVTVQAQIIELVDELRVSMGLTIVWITHDLGVVARLADRVAVMYAGRVVESSPAERFFTSPLHPYARALMGAAPRRGAAKGSRLQALPGQPPDLAELGPGCAFWDRCPVRSDDRCRTDDPPLIEREPGHYAATFCA